MVTAGLVAAAIAAAIGGGGYTADVDNAYFPLQPGMHWVYRGSEGRRAARDVVTVSRRSATIDGVPCAVVRDRVYLDGRLAERTTDWYSQDSMGNVWYYGEATAELNSRGRVKTTEGSWRTGRDGARPGIYMPAHPRVGQSFQQEHYRGHAEDHFSVLSRHASVHVPRGVYRSALLTKEWTPLEPGVRDRKWYVRGIGQVAERTVRGGSERLGLVAFRRR